MRRHRLASSGAGAAVGLLLRQQAQRGFAVVSGEDSHDDFKPQYKTEPVSDAADTIRSDISANEVFIYMKVCMWLGHESVLAVKGAMSNLLEGGMWQLEVTCQ